MKKRLLLAGLAVALILWGCNSPEKEFEKDSSKKDSKNV